jgi:hypothetical protein
MQSRFVVHTRSLGFLAPWPDFERAKSSLFWRHFSLALDPLLRRRHEEKYYEDVDTPRLGLQ